MDIPKFIEENNKLIFWSIARFRRKHIFGRWLSLADCYQESIIIIYRILPQHKIDVGEISTFLDVCLWRGLALKAARERLIIIPYDRAVAFPKGGHSKKSGRYYPYVFRGLEHTDSKEDKRLEPIWANLEKEELLLVLKNAIKTLPNRYKKITELYFGLTEEEPMTLQQIGGLMDISKERVRQLIEISLKKLKEKILKKIS